MGTALKADNVSIRYITGDFKEIGIQEYFVRKLKGDYKVEEFQAVDHVSFELDKGDMLGIVGTNGAGKSTLLKAVAGIMEPTCGKITCNGEIAALLELGSGFDGDLTVKENAYLRGAMLGYTKEFMDSTYDMIIEFAELREFEDRPFKQLSSGMKSRLAFSIASLVDPDILILDEVLSVGDGAFQEKSAAKMREIISRGATTILVSHSITQIRELCNKVLWLDHGKQVAFGETQSICDGYEEYLKTGVMPQNIDGGGYNCSQCEPLTEKSAQNTEKSRISQLDIVRVFAILMVILIHTAEGIYGTGEWVPELTGMSFIVYSLIKLFGRVGVPFFLMLTGYLLLDRDYSDSAMTGKFYKRRFLPMLLACELWIVIYWVLQRLLFVDKLWFGGAQSVSTLLRYLTFQDRNDWQISWYIPVLILLYLFIPFIANGMRSMPKRYIAIPVIWFSVQEIGFWTLNSFFSCFFRGSYIPAVQYLSNTILRFRTDNYGIIGIYFSFALVGLLMRKGMLKGIGKRTLLAAMGLILITSVLWLKAFFRRDGIQYTIWYEWAPVDILAVVMFELITRMKAPARWASVAAWMSKYGLGYFFIHGIVLNLLLAYIPIRTGICSVDTAVYFLATFVISTGAIFLMSKVPVLSRRLLLISQGNQ